MLPPLPPSLLLLLELLPLRRRRGAEGGNLLCIASDVIKPCPARPCCVHAARAVAVPCLILVLLSCFPYRKLCTLVSPCSPVGSVTQPNKALNKTTLTKDMRRVAKTIIKTTQDNYYRPDLTKAVLAKWSLLHAAQKKIKAAK